MVNDMLKTVVKSALEGALPYWPWALSAGLVVLAGIALRSPIVKGKFGQWRVNTAARLLLDKGIEELNEALTL